jgi:four helix bundle protein
MGKFEDLHVWQRAQELCIKIYKVTDNELFSKDFGLKDQVRRASVSIPSNIAEGDESGSDRQSVKYFYTSKGSVAELYTQLMIAKTIGYLDETTFDELIDDCRAVSSMLVKLIKARSTKIH